MEVIQEWINSNPGITERIIMALVCFSSFFLGMFVETTRQKREEDWLKK